jgi:hypothetical protein
MPKLDMNKCRVDPKKVDGGVWWRIVVNPDATFGGRALPGPPGDEPALLIRPSGVDFLRAREAAERPFLADIRADKLSDADRRKIAAEAVAKTLWRGAHNLTFGGDDFVWSEEKAAALLAEVRHMNLLDFIFGAAADRAAIAANEEAAASGN